MAPDIAYGRWWWGGVAGICEFQFASVTHGATELGFLPNSFFLYVCLLPPLLHSFTIPSSLGRYFSICIARRIDLRPPRKWSIERITLVLSGPPVCDSLAVRGRLALYDIGTTL